MSLLYAGFRQAIFRKMMIVSRYQMDAVLNEGRKLAAFIPELAVASGVNQSAVRVGIIIGCKPFFCISGKSQLEEKRRRFCASVEAIADQIASDRPLEVRTGCKCQSHILR